MSVTRRGLSFEQVGDRGIQMSSSVPNRFSCPMNAATLLRRWQRALPMNSLVDRPRYAPLSDWDAASAS
jgi:hypothetical protein